MVQTYFTRKQTRVAQFLSYHFFFHNTALFAEDTPRAKTQKTMRYSIERDPYSLTTGRRGATCLA